MSLFSPKPCPLCPEKDSAHARELKALHDEIAFLREFLNTSGTIVRNLPEVVMVDPPQQTTTSAPLPFEGATVFPRSTMETRIWAEMTPIIDDEDEQAN